MITTIPPINKLQIKLTKYIFDLTGLSLIKYFLNKLNATPAKAYPLKAIK